MVGSAVPTPLRHIFLLNILHLRRYLRESLLPTRLGPIRASFLLLARRISLSFALELLPFIPSLLSALSMKYCYSEIHCSMTGTERSSIKLTHFLFTPLLGDLAATTSIPSSRTFSLNRQKVSTWDILHIFTARPERESQRLAKSSHSFGISSRSRHIMSSTSRPVIKRNEVCFFLTTDQ